jgi:hypothetical protein
MALLVESRVAVERSSVLWEGQLITETHVRTSRNDEGDDARDWVNG